MPLSNSVQPSNIIEGIRDRNSSVNAAIGLVARPTPMKSTRNSDHRLAAMVPLGWTELRSHDSAATRYRGRVPYSTVTDFARLRGWSTSVPRATAVW